MQNRILLLGGGGYIGSRVYETLLNNDIDTQSIDIGFHSSLPNLPSLKTDFSRIHVDLLRSYKTVILLAGHSSVAACNYDIVGSYRNNVVNFTDLLSKLLPQQKFIYASSASVYGLSGETPVGEGTAFSPPLQEYDLQKQTIDMLAYLRNYDYYGLRFGTVCGYSPSPRLDLMINAMTASALKNRSIQVSNPEAYRAVLGINDLCAGVLAIVKKQDPAPGFYNMASFNMSIGDIGAKVAEAFNVEIENLPGKANYSFSLDTTQFSKTFDFEFTDTVQDMALGAANNDLTAIRKPYTYTYL